jgi:hypothetical protein
MTQRRCKRANQTPPKLNARPSKPLGLTLLKCNPLSPAGVDVTSGKIRNLPIWLFKRIPPMTTSVTESIFDHAVLERPSAPGHTFEEQQTRAGTHRETYRREAN